MDFGAALKILKQGGKAKRAGWNGKEQYIELGYDIVYHTDSDGAVQSYHQDVGSKAIVFNGTRGQQVGWLASQSDMLAEDWEEVD